MTPPKCDNDALQRFETIWEHVECGICIIDAETRKILDINPVAARMFGDDKEKIIGKRCHKFICPAEACSCPIMDKGQSVDRSERKFIKADGQAIPIIKSVAKIQYNGRLALLESFTDISNLKEAEAKLVLMSVKEQASQAKSDFLSRMSHEMRTPMNAIIGMTKIAENSDDPAKLKYCLSSISTSSQHLLELINDVLDMSKIESGKLELEHAPLNLEAMFIKICDLILPKAEEKDIKLRVIMDEGMDLRYLGDELRLSQVITNFLSNAVKFTPAGGKITLTAEEVQKTDTHSKLRLTVADTGIGLEPEQIAKLFNAFEQTDVSISRKYGGSGLGLAISKNIVEKMNGSITVNSESGRGSSFSFEVELERLPPEIGSDRAGLPADLKILFVNNDPEDRRQFKALTEYFGITTDEAADREAALAMLKVATQLNWPYDLIFLTIDEAGPNSLETIRQISAQAEAGTLIPLTSFLQWHKMDAEMRHLGITHFISKPLFPSEIINCIRRTLNHDPAAANAAPRGKTTDLSRLTLLLAEDLELNREIFCSLLEDTGVCIDTAENGRIALEKFLADPSRYDAIIMDVQMPEMSGLEATRAIRSLNLPQAANIPIIAVTANAFKEDVAGCLAAGMTDHVAKPLDEKELIDKLLLYCGANCGASGHRERGTPRS